MADYIPRSDADFNLWQASLVTDVQTNATSYGIPTDDVNTLISTQTLWTNNFAKASNKQNRTAADVIAKDTIRKSYEKALRQFVAQWLSNNSKVSDSDRVRMDITVKNTSRTATPVPTTRPVATIDFSIRLKHTIAFTDEGATGKAKPTGAHGCEIWYKIDGTAPVDASELTYMTTDTATPYVANFEGKYAGKIVYYMLRWVNTRNESGPWSGTYSAMIAG
jgi:hypothetical protein